MTVTSEGNFTTSVSLCSVAKAVVAVSNVAATRSNLRFIISVFTSCYLNIFFSSDDDALPSI